MRLHLATPAQAQVQAPQLQDIQKFRLKQAKRLNHLNNLTEHQQKTQSDGTTKLKNLRCGILQYHWLRNIQRSWVELGL